MNQPITLMSQILPDFMNKFFEILALKIFDGNFIIIMPGWLIVHTLFVFLGYYLLKFKLKEERPLIFMVVFILLFEAIEYVGSYLMPIILKEFWQDTLFDILLGLFVLGVAWLVFRNKKVGKK